MENRDYRYDAFISYRHLPADKAAAEKLQKLLERHKRKNGKRLRIFRDQSELPTSSDLGSDIQEALENSRFLIIVCSHSYQDSKWCMQELRYFRQLHGGSNILPLLLEGEPEEVFPQEIRFDTRSIPDENGIHRTVTVEIEPLGADIRASSVHQQLWKLRTEYMRIAAPILGVPFDALYQRAKRRQMFTAVTTAAIVTLAATVFAFYNMHMLAQIDAEHQAMLARESLRLSSESQDALQEGNTNLAMLLAMEALPENIDDPDRPLVEEAEIALRSAVYTRMASEHFSPIQMITSIEFNTTTWSFMGVYQEGKIFAVTDQENIYCYDSATGALLSTCPGNSNDSLILQDGKLMVYLEAESSGTSIHNAAIYDATTGKLLYSRVFHLENQGIELMLSSQSNTLFFVAVSWDKNSRSETLLEAVNPDGTPAAEQILPEKELLQSASFSLSNADYFDDVSDYTRWQGVKTEQGQQYLSLIESLWKEDYYDATITQDEALLIYDTSLKSLHKIYSIQQVEQGNHDCVEIEGTLYIDSVNKRLYCQNGNTLRLYSYHTEKFYAPPFFTSVSEDGSRYAAGCSVYSADDLSEPLLQVACKEEESAGYCLTSDLEYIFVHSPQDSFQLWSVSTGLAMGLFPNGDTDKQATNLAVSENGRLVAIGHDDNSVEVYTNSAEFITSFQFTETINHLEFEETQLLISGTWLSWIVDVSGQTPTIEISDGTQPDHCLTSDGLYLCSGEYFEGALDAIYDLETGECIFSERGYYQYNEEQGILLYIPADPRFAGNPVLHAAKRDENGIFQDIYTVSPREPDMELPRVSGSTDGTYFILLNASCCQVYEIATGELVLTMYVSDEWSDYHLRYFYTFKNNTIYDLRFYDASTPAAYPILDTPELLKAAQKYLTSEYGTRELSGLEKAEFFIE